MTEDAKETRIEARDSSVDTRRRRSTDNPQPLDYVSRKLVREIVENRPATTLSPKSFFQKILKAD
ncbi:MAG: hypothetical protein GY792_05280 [Gammaproteobacteria bacterium]|nr:hypothetical protein [Gammaproteobacteria bacterium]